MTELREPPATPEPPPPPGQARAWPMYRSLVGTGLACGLLIVAVFEVTRPIIRRNKIEARERAIFAVLPGASRSAAYRATPEGRFVAVPTDGPADGEGGPMVFAGFGDDDRLVGLAVEASGMGYQDVIGLLWGYQFERQAIVGIQVLESRETPGLGTRIETDPDFLRNFEQLDVALDASGTALRHTITAVKQGEKEHAWEIDGITGATISSKAVANILAESAAWWVPRLAPRLEDFRAGGQR